MDCPRDSVTDSFHDKRISRPSPAHRGGVAHDLQVCVARAVDRVIPAPNEKRKHDAATKQENRAKSTAKSVISQPRTGSSMPSTARDRL